MIGNGYVVAGDSYYTTALEEASFYGYAGIPCDGGYWVEGENGVRVFRTDGSQVYFSGGERLMGRSGELWLVMLADGAKVVMDNYSRVVVSGDCSFIEDPVTGQTYIYDARAAAFTTRAGPTLPPAARASLWTATSTARTAPASAGRAPATSGSSASRPRRRTEPAERIKKERTSAPLLLN